MLRKASPGSPVCVRITPIPAVESWDPLLEQGSTSQPTDNRIFPPGTTPLSPFCPSQLLDFNPDPANGACTAQRPIPTEFPRLRRA